MKKIMSFLVALSATVCLSGQIEKNSSELGTSFVLTDVGMDLEMIFIQGGDFVMGCLPGKDKKCKKNEMPPHEVSVANFYIGKFEVSQNQWKTLMGSLPDRFDGCDQCPTVDVSWHDVHLFLRKLNQLTGKQYRLPTEAEWEYAAKGGIKTQGFVYSGGNNLEDVAWFVDNSDKSTKPIGTMKPNELGIYDMTGNVWEWCEDRYGLYENKNIPMAKREDIGVERVTRGGARDSYNESCRVVFRSSANPDARSNTLGFRIALSAD